MKTLKQFVAEGKNHPGQAIVSQGGGHAAFIKAGWSHDVEKEGNGTHDVHTYTNGKYTSMAVKHRKTGKVSNWTHDTD